MRIYEQSDKTFLSDNPHETGNVSWYVEAHADRSEGAKPLDSIEANLKLADCYKTINLEFESYNGKGEKQRLAKVRRLLESLELFEEALAGARVARVKAILAYRVKMKGNRFNKDKADDSPDRC